MQFRDSIVLEAEQLPLWQGAAGVCAQAAQLGQGQGQGQP